ncbi:GNAT family N-acetyltransferase [Kitasatospora purpeofusca]|uniref:GNAT family N-acetyltransferase n=1 Tax=Kitasatospora purpeofusca TaxID=67352 RepID=UPI0035E2FFC9
MADLPVSIVEADDELWNEYDLLATRAFGKPVTDVRLLGAHADRRVAVRDGRVVAGGLGLLVPQYFGGRAVPAASMACGSVAAEERGDRLAGRLLSERLHAVQNQGAVLATLWTASNGYTRRLGWEAPTQVYSYSLPTDALTRLRFDDPGFEITQGTSEQVHHLQDDLARQWNGPWQRPAWWQNWQQHQHPDVTTYRFNPPGGTVTGALSVAVENHPGQGRQVGVYDMWAADHRTGAAMLAFLGRFNSRVPTVAFQRTGLPPAPLLPSLLYRGGDLSARSWHPWMLRILDLRRAVELRGWPADIDLDLPLEVVTDDGTATEPYTLRIRDGNGELAPDSRKPRLTLTRGQFAAWYAGGYRSTTAATLAGVDADTDTVAQLLRAAAEREPWLADYF